MKVVILLMFVGLAACVPQGGSTNFFRVPGFNRRPNFNPGRFGGGRFGGPGGGRFGGSSGGFRSGGGGGGRPSGGSQVCTNSNIIKL